MKPLDPQSRHSLQQQIANHLEQRIHSGIYEPGQKLPSLRELGREFDVSHETGKGAVLILQKKGLVELIPSKGTFVLSSSPRANRGNGLIGVVIDNGEGTTPKDQLDILFGNVLKEFHDRVSGYGWHPVSSYVSFRSQVSRTQYLELLEKVEGLVCVNLIDEELARLAQARGIPVVLLLPAINIDDIDTVTLDYYRTYYLAAKELLDSGARDVTYMEHIKPFDAARKRRQGIEEAVADSTIPFVSFSMLDVNSWQMEEFVKTSSSWLKGAPRCDAIICANDNMAAAVIKALQECDIRVPRDLRIVGSRNTSICDMVHPSLTSIDYQYHQLVELSLKRLKARIDGEDTPSLRISLKGNMVHRESTIGESQ